MQGHENRSRDGGDASCSRMCGDGNVRRKRTRRLPSRLQLLNPGCFQNGTKALSIDQNQQEGPFFVRPSALLSPTCFPFPPPPYPPPLPPPFAGVGGLGAPGMLHSRAELPVRGVLSVVRRTGAFKRQHCRLCMGIYAYAHLQV